MKKKILSAFMSAVIAATAFTVPASAAAKISPPASVSVKSKTENSVKISWSKVDEAEKYVVYYSTQKSKGFKKYGTTSKTYVTVKKLKPGTTYYFRIKSRDIDGKKTTDSKLSSYKKCTTKAAVSDKLIITELPKVVNNNDYATITAQGKPNTEYRCSVQYTTKWSEAKGLGKAVSDDNGVVSWTWKIGANTREGEHNIKITGNGEEVKATFKTVRK